MARSFLVGALGYGGEEEVGDGGNETRWRGCYPSSGLLVVLVLCSNTRTESLLNLWCCWPWFGLVWFPPFSFVLSEACGMMEGRPMGEEEEEEERQERQEKVVQFMEIVGESAERARQFLEVCMVEMHRLLGKKSKR